MRGSRSGSSRAERVRARVCARGQGPRLGEEGWTMNRQAELSKARAAGMASATRGRARTFRDRSRDSDGGQREIEEGLEQVRERSLREQAELDRKDEGRLIRANQASEPDPDDPEDYADWDF